MFYLLESWDPSAHPRDNSGRFTDTGKTYRGKKDVDLFGARALISPDGNKLYAGYSSGGIDLEHAPEGSGTPEEDAEHIGKLVNHLEKAAVEGAREYRGLNNAGKVNVNKLLAAFKKSLDGYTSPKITNTINYLTIMANELDVGGSPKTDMDAESLAKVLKKHALK